MAKRVNYQDFVSELARVFGAHATFETVVGYARDKDLLVPGGLWRNNKSVVHEKQFDLSFYVGGDGQKHSVFIPDVPTGHTAAPAPVASLAPRPMITEEPTKEAVRQLSLQAIRNTEIDHSIVADPHYIRWGNHGDILRIIKTKQFFPVFVTGLSGCGKTTTIEQASAQARRECIRVNFTRETNEDDLLGGMRLIDGNTVFQYGPVAEAYLRGAVLILDELDLADPNKVMVLQSVLEGKPVLLKKLGTKLAPAPGFTVFATANTKGKGSIDGRFIGTNSLNEAFLDRFPITIEQNYPTGGTEKKILLRYAADHCGETLTERDQEVITNFVQWGQITRQSFLEQTIDELISTRRLIDAVRTYFIFGRDVEKSVHYITNRFDEQVAESFRELYKQIDGGMRIADGMDVDESDAS